MQHPLHPAHQPAAHRATSASTARSNADSAVNKPGAIDARNFEAHHSPSSYLQTRFPTLARAVSIAVSIVSHFLDCAECALDACHMPIETPYVSERGCASHRMRPRLLAVVAPLQMVLEVVPLLSLLLAADTLRLTTAFGTLCRATCRAFPAAAAAAPSVAASHIG